MQVMQTMIHTIGHGNRSATELIAMLQEACVEVLVDVRAHPSSRRYPQFSRAALQAELARAGIGYEWEGKALGGFRKPRPDSPHLALAAEGFRGYADHMQTPAFEASVARLLEMAEKRRLAIMCAEKNPAECHRSFISDWLTTHGVTVMHLIEKKQKQLHRLNQSARVLDKGLVYDRLAQDSLF